VPGAHPNEASFDKGGAAAAELLLLLLLLVLVLVLVLPTPPPPPAPSPLLLRPADPYPPAAARPPLACRRSTDGFGGLPLLSWPPPLALPPLPPLPPPLKEGLAIALAGLGGAGRRAEGYDLPDAPLPCRRMGATGGGRSAALNALALE
jgi:hypothetical protein